MGAVVGSLRWDGKRIHAAERSHTAEGSTSGSQLPGKGYFGGPRALVFALLFCIIDTREEEEGSGGHPVSWGSRHGWRCPPCLYLPGGPQWGGWPAVPFTEILQLIRCGQGLHPRPPGVGSREYSGIDAPFSEIWLSWASGQIARSFSKVKGMAA